MWRKIGLGSVFAGAVLVILALSLYAVELRQEAAAGSAAEEALIRVMLEIEASDAECEETDTPCTDMTVVTIDGWDYIGYLSVPSLGLELPVMAQWSCEGLDIAPGRYSGSILTDDLVIAGHNYRRHFSLLRSAAIGTKVIFTDMDGNAYYYEIIRTETLEPTQIEEMTGKTQDDDWDLTLFTCTVGGQARVAIRCARAGAG